MRIEITADQAAVASELDITKTIVSSSQPSDDPDPEYHISGSLGDLIEAVLNAAQITVNEEPVLKVVR